jgi:tRNA(Ile)-lysidine synthase
VTGRTVRPADEGAALTLEEAEALLRPGLAGAAGAPGLVLAVSGGPDSTALLHFAALVRDRFPARPLLVATVDHGLRPDSGAEAAAVARQAGSAGLAHAILTWRGPKPSAGLQEAARRERYRLLADFARERGASHILTAHTRDDQAETVLMRLLRGSGLQGLRGMRPAVPLGGVTLARPFLAVPKARLVAACRAQGWTFVEDPSNRDPRFTRARLRALLPLLAAEGLTAERLLALAGRIARADEALERQAEAAFAARRRPGPEGRLELDGRRLGEEPLEIVVRVLARAVAEVASPDRPLPLDALEALAEALAAGEDPVAANLAGVLVARRPDGLIAVTPEPERRRGRYPSVGGRP